MVLKRARRVSHAVKLVVSSASLFALTYLPLTSAYGKSDVKFESFIVDSDAKGPAFAELADLDGDGQDEIIVSKFGKMAFPLPNGEVSIYKRGDSLSEWTKTDLVTPEDGIKFPNHPVAHDVSKNGRLDIVLPFGFLACELVPFGKPCGGLALFENTGEQFIRHDIVAPGNDLFFHSAVFIDLNGNGIEDLVTVGERKGGAFGRREDQAVTLWFKGIEEAPYFESTPRVLSDGLGSLPVLRDITGNGHLDIASAEYFHSEHASFAWLEQIAPVSLQNPNGVFKRHVIDEDNGPAIMLKFIPDLYGDGVTRAVGSNHTNTTKRKPDPWESGIYVYDIPKDPRLKWERTKISEGIRSRPGNMINIQAAPGIFGVGDLNGSGLKDLVVSGDGDKRIFWLEQTNPGTFETHVLLEDFGQAGAMIISDLNQDGSNEAIVSSYEKGEVRILKLRSK